jgi:N-acetylneuraminic acid mutarotase
MNEPRIGSPAVLLQDGRVLVSGGFNGTNNTAYSSAEIYDPSTGVWTTTGVLVTARGFPTATLLFNGKVLIAGGMDSSGNILSSAELFDPSAGEWTATGSMTTARWSGTATLLPSGKVLLAGGSSGTSLSDILSSSEIYDPGSDSWSATGSMNTARDEQTATLLPNGEVLVVGGVGSKPYIPPITYQLGSAELYNPSTGVWTTTGSLTTQRQQGTMNLLPDGNVVVFGGYDGNNYLDTDELYTTTTGTWSLTGSLPTRLGAQTSTLLLNGKVLIAGGYDGFTNGEFAAAYLYF